MASELLSSTLTAQCRRRCADRERWTFGRRLGSLGRASTVRVMAESPRTAGDAASADAWLADLDVLHSRGSS